ncbi:hypothetical protein Zm00014a_010709 [Zea mays]|jgi:EREBP-like factor|uniref:Uncharacterized protein n=1 Tax=Zea mays TaxID=4577 RepID=A0A3L6ENJ9_MAIZE|nr:hypothetical protein Zm00014a_010709 [Zea mays]
MPLPPSLELDLFHHAAAEGKGTAAVRFPFGSIPVTHSYYFFGQAAAAAEAGCRVLKLALAVTVVQRTRTALR